MTVCIVFPCTPSSDLTVSPILDGKRSHIQCILQYDTHIEIDSYGSDFFLRTQHIRAFNTTMFLFKWMICDVLNIAGLNAPHISAGLLHRWRRNKQNFGKFHLCLYWMKFAKLQWYICKRASTSTMMHEKKNAGKQFSNVSNKRKHIRGWTNTNTNTKGRPANDCIATKAING